MKRCRIPHIASIATAFALMALGDAAQAQRLDGFNVIATPAHPFGAEGAAQSLASARRLGARAIAIIPFFWQANPTSPDIQRGADMNDATLRDGIRQARQLGLQVIVKPHVWVEGSWAGAVAPNSEKGWRQWFAQYQRELSRIAVIASEEGADCLAIGTELVQTSHRPEWRDVIATTRALFPGKIIYVAHNADEAETIAFWTALDAIGASLYPPLGADDDRAAHRAAMRAEADRLDTIGARMSKPIFVAEIGLRSATGAAAKPWESAEERDAPPDAALQARVVDDWLDILDRPSVKGIMVWRWFTDPAAGGAHDTDFTVQGKPAETILSCRWTGVCRPLD